MNLPTEIIQNAVQQLSKLPGIGKKSALRLAIHLLKQDITQVEQLSESLIKMKKETTYCKRCHNIAEKEFCKICSTHQRDPYTICVVENFQDVIAIENTTQYNGLYHVLGGIIQPVEGISPEQLNIDTLLKRVETEKPKEIILAINPSIEGDTTMYYLYKRLQGHDVHITSISRGISFGSELEYTDEITLGRSIRARVQFDTVMQER